MTPIAGRNSRPRRAIAATSAADQKIARRSVARRRASFVSGLRRRGPPDFCSALLEARSLTFDNQLVDEPSESPAGERRS